MKAFQNFFRQVLDYKRRGLFAIIFATSVFYGLFIFYQVGFSSSVRCAGAGACAVGGGCDAPGFYTCSCPDSQVASCGASPPDTRDCEIPGGGGTRIACGPLFQEECLCTPPPPPPGLTCPASHPLVSLSDTAIDVTQTATASAPAGSGYSVTADSIFSIFSPNPAPPDTNVVSLSGPNSRVIRGEGGGTAQIKGSGLTYTDGMRTVDGCSLNPAPITVKDFTIDATPDRIIFYPGDRYGYSVSVIAVNRFTEPVNISYSGLPSGMTVSSPPDSPLAPGQTSTLGLTNTAATPGIYPITFTGSYHEHRHSKMVTLEVKAAPIGSCAEAGLALSPTTATINVMEPITITGVNFASDNPPTIWSVTGNLEVVAGSARTTSVTVRGTNGGMGTVLASGVKAVNGATACSVVPATITVRDFRVTASPFTQIVTQTVPPAPTSASYLIEVGADPGFSGTVALSQTGAPGSPGPITFDQSSGIPPFNTYLRIPISEATQSRTYTINITGTYNGHQHSDSVNLTVNPADQPPDVPNPPSLTFSASCPSGRLTVDLHTQENRGPDGRGPVANEINLYRERAGGEPVFLRIFTDPRPRPGLILGDYTDVLSPPPPLQPSYSYKAISSAGSFSPPARVTVITADYCRSGDPNLSLGFSVDAVTRSGRTLSPPFVSDIRNGDIVKLKLRFENAPGAGRVTDIRGVQTRFTPNFHYSINSFSCKSIPPSSVDLISQTEGSLTFNINRQIDGGSAINCFLNAQVQTSTAQRRELLKVTATGGTYNPGGLSLRDSSYSLLAIPSGQPGPRFQEIAP